MSLQSVRRVLIVCDEFPPFSLGGDGVTALRIAQGLEARGCNVAVACNEQPAGGERSRAVHRIFMRKSEWKSLDKEDLDTASKAMAIEAQRLERIVDAVAPEVLLCLHQWGLAPATVLRIGDLKVPKVYRFGDEWLRLHLLQRLSQEPWSRLCARRELVVDAAIANSAELARRVGTLLGIAVRVIRNSVDIGKFVPSASKPLAGRGASLLFVGRMVRHKGADLALQTLAWLIDRGIDVRLSLVGAAPADTSSAIDVRQEAARLGVTRHVTITGQIAYEKMPGIYAAHDILLFPSRPREPDRTIEGCPNVLVEATATAMPIVCAPGSGVDEFAIDGKTALLSRTPDAAGLGAAIARLLQNPQLVRALRDEMLRRRASLALEFESAGVDEVLGSVC